MDKQEALRRVAEAHRLLAEGRKNIDRQRDLIARLEHVGIDPGKQQAMLSRLLQEQSNREGRLAELLGWLESESDQQPNRQHIAAKPG